MNTVAIVACLVLGCIAISEAQNNYAGRPRPRPIKPIIGSGYCIDYRGNPVAPGQSYYDGCNTCRCGVNGMPSLCTLRACGPFNGGGHITGRPVGRVW
ncbi:hypothetical protein DPMN_050675 [Dreissena polymorpha]|uniref:Pacifastin domain-containing protein n=1 Tax=Dreissena polymorpha TaxID=45954 RepID=A0A9D4CGK5_DREPO|nr:hypothetical protein DPMN_050675 [Dreissena polymorpha]